jgi:hypothetical protein
MSLYRIKMAESNPEVRIRLEIFDHGIFPCPAKLNTKSLINIVKSLYLVSTIDYKITAANWHE